MAWFYDIFLGRGRFGRDASDKGVFATPSALTTRWPTGKSGWHAYIETTDTTWSWDSNTNAWVNSGALATPAWGNINGTLNNQTDLKNALIGKEAANSNIQGHIATTGTPHVSTAEKNSWNSAVSAKHTQGTDTGLDTGGANPITAATAKGHVDTTGTPHVSTAEKNAWNAMTPKLSGDVNYYIDPIAGSDSNNGTIGAPFKTIMYALGLIPQNMGGCTATIFLKDSLLYAEHVHVYNYYNGFMFIRAVNAGNVLNTVNDIVFDVFDCANVEFLGIAMKTTVNSGACVLAQMNSNVTVYSCQFSDNVNSATVGVSVITNSKAYCTNCTDYDANKVAIGFSANTGFLFDMGSNAVGISATLVAGGGMISDTITLKKADYDSAVSLKHSNASDHAAATAGAGIGVAGQQISNSDTGSGAVNTHQGTYDHTLLHAAATAGAGISIAGQVVTCTVSPGTSLPIGTIVRSPQSPGASWHRCDGSTLTQAGHPLLYAQLGLLHDFASWTLTGATEATYAVCRLAEGPNHRIGACGNNVFYYSDDEGATWTKVTGGYGTNRALVYSPDNSRWLCGAESGRIYTSDDNMATWTRRDVDAGDPMGGQSIHDAIWGGTKFYIVGETGKMASSSDGITWSSLTTGKADTLKCVVRHPVSGRLIIMCTANNHVARYSDNDGANWTDCGGPNLFNSAYRMHWATPLQAYVVMGTTSKTQCSLDGIRWGSELSPSFNYGIVDFHFDSTGNHFLAVQAESQGNVALYHKDLISFMNVGQPFGAKSLGAVLHTTSKNWIIGNGASTHTNLFAVAGFSYSSADSFRLPRPILDDGIYYDSWILGD